MTNDELKIGFISLIDKMPMGEDELREEIKKLVDNKTLRPCMPVFESNYVVLSAMITLNRYVKE